MDVEREDGPSPYEVVAAAAAGKREEAYMLQRDLGRGGQGDGNPLLEATQRSDVETVGWCLAQGCDPDASPTKEKKTALHYAVDSNVHPNITRSLLRSEASVDQRNDDGYTPLMDLAWRHDSEHLLTKATLLLDAGADPNKFSRSGIRPLGFVIRSDKGDLAKLLLQRGADPKGTPGQLFSFWGNAVNPPPSTIYPPG